MWRVQCAWCLRLKGHDGRPYGPPMPRAAGWSHGICVDCLRTAPIDPERIPEPILASNESFRRSSG